MNISPKNARLKPASPGLIIRDPKTAKPLPEKGELKNLTDYWRRRVRDGDVVTVQSRKKGE